MLPYFPRPLATVAPRDLLLWDFLHLSSSDSVLEIGVGTGSSIIRLAPRVREMHGADVAAGSVHRLSAALGHLNGRVPNAKVFVQDFCDDALPSALRDRYDVIFSCDTVEHVSRPARFFRNVYQALKPGGRALITFPNEAPARAHGITWFDRRDALEHVIATAGFEANHIDLAQVRMAPAASTIMAVAWGLPRKACKLLLKLTRRPPVPQVFDDTDFFSLSARLEPIAPAINLYSWVVMRLMAAVGAVYRIEPLPGDIWDRQILVRVSRSG
jgi:SAM-dependent methyltransferase